MEDPVYVFGRTDMSRYKENRTFTFIHVPDTDWYMYDEYDGERTMRIFSCKRNWIGKGIVLSSMVIERIRLIKIIQDLATYRDSKTSRDSRLRDFARPRLEAWKAHLVLERIRRNVAARTIQRQFRESMSNPAYALCNQRLLREFAEGIKSYRV